MKYSNRRYRLLILTSATLLLSGCSMYAPVKPYERGTLADPIMQFSREPLTAKYRRHVFEVREGARGAIQGQGGGCGCN